MKPLPPLDSTLHNPIRLAIISVLMHVKEADFSYLQETTEATNGNLSVQISKLKEAGYIDVRKTFVNNYPKTNCQITRAGKKAFELYVQNLKSYIHIKK